MKVRKFAGSDAESCCVIALENWKNYLCRFYTAEESRSFTRRYTAEQFKEHSRKHDVYVVAEGSNVLAFASVRKLENAIEIRRFFVKLALRSKGIGTKLLKFILDTYKGENIIVESSRSSETISFYEKRGFSKVKETKNGVLMEIRISQ